MTDTIGGERIRAMVGDRVPGLVVMVVEPEGVHAAGADGLADIASQVPASSRMVCPWFSMTKLVTATTAVRLSERGLLDLDEPIGRHLPIIRRLQPSSAAASITARHLLTHSAGLPNPVPIRWVHPADRPGPDPDVFLERLLSRHRKLRFEPGTRSSYTNLGALALGAAMANLTGTRFEDLVSQEILDPLHMTGTGFGYGADSQTRAATGYHRRYDPLRLLLPSWVVGQPTGRWISLRRFLVDGAAYGGLVGPVEDAARFLRMHLCDGELDGVQILGPDAAKLMRRIAVRGRRYDLGLGWFRPASRRRADPPFVEHLGGGAGFMNVMRIYPSHEVGVVVMGNATRYDIDAVARVTATE